MNNAFDFDTYMIPFWQGNTVYDETLMFIRKEDGTLEPAPLLYEPMDIKNVMSYSLLKTFEPERDYLLKDGRLVLPPDSTIPVWDYDSYYPVEPLHGHSFEARDKGRYILYGEGNTFTSRQIAVTYSHNDKWSGPVPAPQGKQLPHTLQILESGGMLRLLFYGDSITVGCNASAYREFPTPPFMPVWPDLVAESLRRRYPKSYIASDNTAVGGKDSNWGLENAQQLAACRHPDLTVLAFGMNDGNRSATEFCNNIRGIIDTVRQSNPAAEFLLVATTLPNAEATGFLVNQGIYEEAMKTEFPDCPVVPMTTLHRYLLERKRFPDMTGNNINHPNDFLCRLYAQAIVRTLETTANTALENGIWRI